jgi:hypothetical protein
VSDSILSGNDAVKQETLATVQDLKLHVAEFANALGRADAKRGTKLAIICVVK